ncbi:hypothetical protein [Streptomyces sp. DT171]|uniref:hypothetical protein n=1 Tax=Streptomyces sp. DT171 TaxID=3416524 RepID=UPI003CF2768E
MSCTFFVMAGKASSALCGSEDPVKVGMFLEDGADQVQSLVREGDVVGTDEVVDESTEAVISVGGIEEHPGVLISRDAAGDVFDAAVGELRIHAFGLAGAEPLVPGDRLETSRPQRKKP